MAQVYQLPTGQIVQDTGGVLLPSFPALAYQLDAYAVRIPWYVWLVAGAYIAYRLLARTR